MPHLKLNLMPSSRCRQLLLLFGMIQECITIPIVVKKNDYELINPRMEKDDFERGFCDNSNREKATLSGLGEKTRKSS